MTDESRANGFAQKALVVVFTAIVLAMVGGLGSFFYWLAGSTIEISERATRIEERATRIEEKVGSLLTTRTDQAREQSDRNTRRIEQIERSSQ